MKKIFAILSLVVGVVGVGVFFNPPVEIACGVGGLILALLAKNKDAGHFISSIRSWGSFLAWINILWVCLEYGLKAVGIELFQS